MCEEVGFSCALFVLLPRLLFPNSTYCWVSVSKENRPRSKKTRTEDDGIIRK